VLHLTARQVFPNESDPWIRFEGKEKQYFYSLILRPKFLLSKFVRTLKRWFRAPTEKQIFSPFITSQSCINSLMVNFIHFKIFNLKTVDSYSFKKVIEYFLIMLQLK